jgi:hypothetical protein
MAHVANSPAHARFSRGFSGKLSVVTRTFSCDPHCEDLPKMTKQAHSADNPATAGAANPQTNSMNPADQPVDPTSAPSREIGGRQGPEPTRYGDWEMRGRCIDF